MLNENENFNANVLKEVFKGYSDADITNGIHYIFKYQSAAEEAAGTTIDFNKYTIDKDIGNYMNLLHSAWKKARETGDSSEMDKIIEDFLYTDVYEKQNYSIAACYYTYGRGTSGVIGTYYAECEMCVDNGNFCGLQELTENKVKTLVR